MRYCTLTKWSYAPLTRYFGLQVAYFLTHAIQCRGLNTVQPFLCSLSVHNITTEEVSSGSLEADINLEI